MGKMYSFYCKKCKIRIEAKFGIGMMFPNIYRNTVYKAKNGELGEEIQKFFLENPNGAIDVSIFLSSTYLKFYLQPNLFSSFFLSKFRGAL